MGCVGGSVRGEYPLIAQATGLPAAAAGAGGWAVASASVATGDGGCVAMALALTRPVFVGGRRCNGLIEDRGTKRDGRVPSSFVCACHASPSRWPGLARKNARRRRGKANNTHTQGCAVCVVLENPPQSIRFPCSINQSSSKKCVSGSIGSTDERDQEAGHGQASSSSIDRSHKPKTALLRASLSALGHPTPTPIPPPATIDSTPSAVDPRRHRSWDGARSIEFGPLWGVLGPAVVGFELARFMMIVDRITPHTHTYHPLDQSPIHHSTQAPAPCVE